MSLNGADVKHTPEPRFLATDACYMPAAGGSKGITEINP